MLYKTQVTAVKGNKGYSNTTLTRRVQDFLKGFRNFVTHCVHLKIAFLSFKLHHITSLNSSWKLQKEAGVTANSNLVQIFHGEASSTSFNKFVTLYPP